MHKYGRKKNSNIGTYINRERGRVSIWHIWQYVNGCDKLSGMYMVVYCTFLFV